MSSDGTRQLSPVSPISNVQLKENFVSNTPRAPKKVAEEQTFGDAQVKLSDAQTLLMQPNEQDIDMNQVERIKQALVNGELKMDAGKIADALLQDLRSTISHEFQASKKA